MSVASWSGALLSWQAELSALKERLGPLLGRRELRESAAAFLDGVLSGVERKTGWLLSEQTGAARPYRLQSLLGRSRWEADELMHGVRSYVADALGDPDGVLVVDETGFLKKGAHSVGVGRQYSGTAGRIENCQIGVFLSYASRFGHALIDRRLYLPKDWAEDDARRAKAAIPDNRHFMTKPEIARDLIRATLETGVPCAYVLADALYGSDKSLRVMLEQREQPHVLAVRSNERLMAGSFRTRTAAEIADSVPQGDWQRLAAGQGAKGPRLYDWARVRLFRLQEPGQPFDHWLLIRRSLRAPHERAYYVVFAPADVSLAELAGVAGLRWTIETCFETAKDELGLDHCEARSWHAWHRHMSLVMAGLAFLAKLRADLLRISIGQASPGKRNERSPCLVGAPS